MECQLNMMKRGLKILSKYTTELRYLIENEFDIGLKTYPIFDENYRKILNSKIIEHFYFREIGFETAELFKRYLNRTMNEIMPYYNQLYKSETIEFNPLHNYDKWETADRETKNNTQFNGWAKDTQTETGENSGHGTNKTTGTVVNATDNLVVGSDTPQGMLSIGNIKGNTYASNAEMTDGTTRTTYDENGIPLTVTSDTNGSYTTDREGNGTSGTDTQQQTDEYILRHFSGKSEGESYSEMLQKYRETFLNIDMLIIGDLETCFMMIY